MSCEYNELTEHIIHCHCHKVVTSNLNVFNKFFLKDSFKVGLLFKLQQEKPGFVTLFLWVQLSAVWDQCDASNSNSSIRELTSYKSRTQREERKQKIAASWTHYIKSRKAALHFAVRAHLAPQASVKTSTAKPTSRTKAGDISYTEGISICATLRTAVGKWHVPTWQSHFGRCLSQPHRQSLIEEANEQPQQKRKAIVWEQTSKSRCISLAARRAQGRLGQEAFLGGRGRCLRCKKPRAARVVKAAFLCHRPWPEQKWASPSENVTALAGEDLVWRLIWVNCKGLFFVGARTCACARAGVRINWVHCQGLIFNDASLL